MSIQVANGGSSKSQPKNFDKVNTHKEKIFPFLLSKQCDSFSLVDSCFLI
jgi:hypothetical protein